MARISGIDQVRVFGTHSTGGADVVKRNASLLGERDRQAAMLQLLQNTAREAPARTLRELPRRTSSARTTLRARATAARRSRPKSAPRGRSFGARSTSGPMAAVCRPGDRDRDVTHQGDNYLDAHETHPAGGTRTLPGAALRYACICVFERQDVGIYDR